MQAIALEHRTRTVVNSFFEQDAYNTLVVAQVGPSLNGLIGGNYNFDSTAVTIFKAIQGNPSIRQPWLYKLWLPESFCDECP